MKAKRCNCGKNRRGTKISCVSDICPCKKNESPCTRACRFHNCRNVDHISNTSGRENGMDETAFNKGYRCGQGNKSKDDDLMQESCRDGSRKSRFPCVARGIGCTNLCKCINCANIIQARVAQVTPMKQRKRKRELVSPYKRKKGKEFMEDQKASISSGTWRNLETFCLIVCREVLLSHSISENPGNFKLLYNFVAQSDSVKAMLPPISVKSTSQIAAKIAYSMKFEKV